MLNRRKFVTLSGAGLVLASTGAWFKLNGVKSVSEKSFTSIYGSKINVLVWGKGPSSEFLMDKLSNHSQIQITGLIQVDNLGNTSKFSTYSNFNEVLNKNIPIDVICVVGHKPGHSALMELKNLNADLWLDRPSDLDNHKCASLNESFAQKNKKVLFAYMTENDLMFMANNVISV